MTMEVRVRGVMTVVAAVVTVVVVVVMESRPRGAVKARTGPEGEEIRGRRRR